MPDSPDRLARAYATLGLRPGCSQREAARQYKRLVRRWHPDQYESDSQGRAEAAQRMREVNRAFAVLRHSARAQERVAAPVASDTNHGPRTRFFGQRLGEADIQEITDSIGSPAYFATFARYCFWSGSLVVGGFLTVMSPRGQRPRTANVVAGILLLGAAAAHWTYSVWFKERR